MSNALHFLEIRINQDISSPAYGNRVYLLTSGNNVYKIPTPIDPARIVYRHVDEPESNWRILISESAQNNVIDLLDELRKNLIASLLVERGGAVKVTITPIASSASAPLPTVPPSASPAIEWEPTRIPAPPPELDNGPHCYAQQLGQIDAIPQLVNAVVKAIDESGLAGWLIDTISRANRDYGD